MAGRTNIWWSPIPSYITVKIVGGTEITPNEFPFLAYLQVNFTGTDGFQQLCGGSIYNENHIITAAHCVGFPGDFESFQVRVVAGKHSADAQSSHEQIRLITQINIHPNYSRETLENDIAILKMESPLIFNERVSAISIATTDPAVNSRVVVAGWGRLRTFATSAPPIPRKVSVRVFSNPYCSLMYGLFNQVTDAMLCAGIHVPIFGTKGSCQGDSGGPLFTERKPHRLVGVVSWGMGCALLSYPQVYARVPHFADYIKSIAGFQFHRALPPPRLI